MTRAVTIGLAVLTWLMTAPAVLAQDQAAQAGDGDGPNETSVLEMFFWSELWVGRIVIILLLAMSVFTIGYIILLLLQYRRPALVPSETRDEMADLIAEKKYRDAIELARTDDSYLGRLTSSALMEASNGFGAMERAIEETGDTETTRYLRPVEYLNVVGNIAPMLGLFGTVYGMIRAFQQLQAATGGPNPQDLAGGISTALVTTLWGLVVAIPALAGYALVRNKIDALTSEGIVEAEQIIATFKPGRRSSSSSSSSGGSSGGGGGQQRPRATPKPDSGDSGGGQ